MNDNSEQLPQTAQQPGAMNDQLMSSGDSAQMPYLQTSPALKSSVSPMMAPASNSQAMLAALPQLPAAGPAFVGGAGGLTSALPQQLQGSSKTLFPDARPGRVDSFGNQLNSSGRDQYPQFNPLSNSDRSLNQLHASGHSGGQSMPSQRPSHADGTTLNDYDLDSCDPFIDFLNKDVPGQMNYGINSMLEGQRPFNNFNPPLNAGLPINAMGANQFQAPNTFNDQGVNLNEGALPNLQTFQSQDTLAGNAPTQAQPMQVQAAAPIQQQQAFQPPIERASPEADHNQSRAAAQYNVPRGKIPKTQSMANVHADPDSVSGGGSGNAPQQTRKAGPRGIPKSQSDHNLILMSSNLSKNIVSSDGNQVVIGGRGTRRKEKTRNKQGALTIGQQLSASKSNRGGYGAHEQDIVMQVGHGQASSSRKSGAGSRGGRGSRPSKTASDNNLLSLQQRQSDAVGSLGQSSNVSDYSNGPALRRQIQQEFSGRKNNASKRDLPAAAQNSAPSQQKQGILRNAPTSSFCVPTALLQDAGPNQGHPHQVEFNVPAVTRQQINEERQNAPPAKKRKGRRSQSDSATRQEQRLAKNRVSAANSRRRKKAYIEELEEAREITEMKFADQEKEIIRLRTINHNLKKQLSLQEPVLAGGPSGQAKDKFFTERIQDFLRLEENLLEPLDGQDEIKEVIERLNGQSGAYGARRKDLVNNLFRSIIELSTPGFVEYLFWLIETKGEIFGDMFDDLTTGPNDPNTANKRPSEPEEFGFDEQTGTHFMKERRRKPTRYFVNEEGQPGKFSESMRTLNWMELTPEQANYLRGQAPQIQAHYQRFRQLIDTLMETKDGVLLEMKAMDQTTQQLKKFLNPTQIAKFLLLADKSKTTQEFDIFRLWEIKKNHRNLPPGIDHLLEENVHSAIPAEHFASSNEVQQDSSLSLKQPDDASSQGGFVPNEEDEQNDILRQASAPGLAQVEDQVMGGPNMADQSEGGSTMQIAAGGATMGNNNEQKQRNFQQQHNQKQQNMQDQPGQLGVNATNAPGDGGLFPSDAGGQANQMRLDSGIGISGQVPSLLSPTAGLGLNPQQENPLNQF